MCCGLRILLLFGHCYFLTSQWASLLWGIPSNVFRIDVNKTQYIYISDFYKFTFQNQWKVRIRPANVSSVYWMQQWYIFWTWILLNISLIWYWLDDTLFVREVVAELNSVVFNALIPLWSSVHPTACRKLKIFIYILLNVYVMGKYTLVVNLTDIATIARTVVSMTTSMFYVILDYYI